MRLLAFLLLLLPLPVAGEDIVAALSQSRISITANFDGSEILVFGAIKRDAPVSGDAPLDVIITVAGPEQVEVLRRKDRRLGIWVNVEARVIGHTPTFYTVAATRPLGDVLPNLTDTLWKISAEKRILPAMRGLAAREALLRIRRAEGVYATDGTAVDLIEDTLFRSSIALPANLVEGAYTTRIFLVRDGRVIDSYGTSINVQKVGIERWLYRLAYDHAFIYGLLALFIAVVFGWGASEAFRLLRR
ncbi:TIGR02186 family protein [Celeribacter arenosi]|uniref:TIGR02186 family protein n=2 Tax=Celeribacter arenosi TaxID=792649 RepID=A0ABP7K3C8_9RHOB